MATTGLTVVLALGGRKLAAQAPAILEGHQHAVSSAAYTPAGDVLATAGFDRAIRLWRTADGAALRTLEGHEGQVLSVAIDGEGRLLASGGRDGTVRLWDILRPGPIGGWSGHEGAVTALTTWGDGVQVATGGADKTVRIWDTATGAGKPLAEPLTGAVTTLASGGAVAWIAAGDATGEVRLWQSTDGVAQGRLLAHDGEVVGAALHPSQPLLVTCGVDGSLKWWQLPVTAPVVVPGGGPPVVSLAGSADLRFIAIGADKVVRLVDAMAPNQPGKASSPLAQAVVVVAVRPDGQQVAVADAQGAVRVWNVADGAWSAPLVGHAGPVRCLSFHPQGAQLLTGGDDSTIRLWRLPQAAKVAPAQGPQPTLSRYSVDGKLLASAGVAGGKPVVVLRDAASGAVTATLAGHEGAVTCLGFSPDGATIITGSADKTARVWNAAGGAQVGMFTHEQAVRAVALGVGGQQACSIGDGGAIQQWNVADGQPVRELAGHTGAITSLTVAGAGAGATLVSASADGTVRLWNLADGAAKGSLANTQPALLAVANAGATHVAAAGADQQVRVWTVADGKLQATVASTGQPPLAVAVAADGERFAVARAAGLFIYDVTGRLLEQPAPVALPADPAAQAIAWSADGATLAACGVDGALRVHSLSLVRLFPGHTAAVGGVAWIGDGSQFVSGGADKLIRLWNVADGATVRDFAGATAPVSAVASAGARLVAATADKSALVWTLADGAVQGALEHAAQGAVVGVSLSADGARATTAGADGLVQLWDLNTRRRLERFDGHQGALSGAVLRADGKQLVSAGADGAVRVSQVAALQLVVMADEPALRGLASLPDGSQIAVIGATPSVRWWASPAPQAQPARQLAGLAAAPVRVVVRPDGQQAAAVDAGGKLVLWNLANNQPVATLELGAAPADIAFSPDNLRLAALLADGALKVYSLAEMPQLVQEQAGAGPATALRFGAGRTLLTAGADGVVHVWAEASPLALRSLTGHTGQVNDVAFVPLAPAKPEMPRGPQWILSAGQDQTVRLWDAATGAALRQFAGAAGPQCAVCSDNAGQRVVAGGADGIVRIWDLASGAVQRELPFGESKAAVLDVAFSPDGTLLAASGVDGRTRIWNAASGAETRVLEGGSPSYSVVFNATGTRLLVCGQAGKVGVHNVADGAAVHAADAPGVPYQAILSPDGARAAVACADGKTRLLDLPAAAR